MISLNTKYTGYMANNKPLERVAHAHAARRVRRCALCCWPRAVTTSGGVPGRHPCLPRLSAGCWRTRWPRRQSCMPPHTLATPCQPSLTPRHPCHPSLHNALACSLETLHLPTPTCSPTTYLLTYHLLGPGRSGSTSTPSRAFLCCAPLPS